MSGIRPMIESAVAQAIAEHPKYFTELGLDNSRARTAIVRKVWAVLRGDGGDKAQGEAGPSTESTTTAPALPQPMSAAKDSPEAKAYANLRRMAGAIAQFRGSDGSTFINAEANNPAVFAFADLPDEEEWLFVTDRRQIASWLEFFGRSLPGVTRRSIQQLRGDQTGIIVPWPFPPSKTGTVYRPEVESP